MKSLKIFSIVLTLYLLIILFISYYTDKNLFDYTFDFIFVLAFLRWLLTSKPWDSLPHKTRKSLRIMVTFIVSFSFIRLWNLINPLEVYGEPYNFIILVLLDI